MLYKKLVIKVVYNAIFIIIYKNTKYIYIVLYKELYTTKDLIYTFLKIVYTNYKLLNKIISN
jgi:hypothetical protein